MRHMLYSVIAIEYRIVFELTESGLGSKTGIGRKQTERTLGAADNAWPAAGCTEVGTQPRTNSASRVVTRNIPPALQRSGILKGMVTPMRGHHRLFLIR
jgi:hypothetical protein